MNRWEGTIKDLTKDCRQGCQYYTVISKEERCYWGIAWKRLKGGRSLKKCAYKDVETPREKELRKL